MNTKRWIALGVVLLALAVIFFTGFSQKPTSLLDFIQKADLYANVAFGICGIVVTWLLYEAASKLRFRYVYMLFGSLLALTVLFFASPDNGFIQDLTFGAGFIATIAVLFKAVIYNTVLHYSRKGLFDYVDLQPYFEKALESSVGAGLALIAVAGFVLSIAALIAVAVVG